MPKKKAKGAPRLRLVRSEGRAPDALPPVADTPVVSRDPDDTRLNARVNRLLVAVDALLKAEEQYGAPVGWDGWLAGVRQAREQVP